MLVKGDDSSGMVAEINVTPLVDVMLVLMIVFMVTAPLLIPQSLGVKLPKTDSVKASMDRSLMRLTLDPGGMLHLNGRALDDKALKSVLSAKKEDADFQLQIEADEDLRYGRLAEVMALAQSAGVKKLSFVTVTNQK